jgi:hypothetical protein
VSAPSLFSSADGRSWDDVRIPLPVSLLPVNTVSQVASVALPAVQPADCLAWGWAALTYQY